MTKKQKLIIIASFLVLALGFGIVKLIFNDGTKSTLSSPPANSRANYACFYGKVSYPNPLFQWGNTGKEAPKDTSDIGYTLVFNTSTLTSQNVLSFARRSLCSPEEFVKQDSESILYIHHYIDVSPGTQKCNAKIKCIATADGLTIRVSNDVEDSVGSMSLNEGTLDVIRNEAAK